jgi:hypothetical protein
MNQNYEPLAIGFKLGQGVSSLTRILCSLKLYQKNDDNEVIARLVIEVQALIDKLTI